MVATLRRAVRRSGARVPNALHAPLNSSIWAMSLSISGVMCRLSAVSISNKSSKNIHLVKPKNPQHKSEHVQPLTMTTSIKMRVTGVAGSRVYGQQRRGGWITFAQQIKIGNDVDLDGQKWILK